MIKKYLLILFAFGLNLVQAQERNLDFYIQKATENSPILFKNKTNAAVFKLNLEQVRRVLSKPEINLDASVLFAPIISHDNNTTKFELSSGGATNYNGYDLALSNGGQYIAMVAARQPLFTGSSFKKYEEKSAILEQQSQNNTNLTKHELEQLVKNQYLLCLKAKKESAISLEQLTELKSQVAIMKKLVANAIYKQTDLLLLQLEYQNYNQAYETNLAAYKAAIYDLNLLCGIQETNIPETIQDVDFQLKTTLNNASKFLISYQLDSLALQADQQITELKYKPQVNLVANSGLNASYRPSINRIGFSTGVSLTWNLFDGNQRSLQRKITELNLQSLSFDKNNFKKQNEIYKAKILDQINMLSTKIKLLNTQLQDYNKLVKIYYSEFSQTIISIMDYKNLLKDVNAKKMERLQLETEKEILINSYNYWNY